MGWAALMVLIVCALPLAYVLRQVIRGRLTDRHVRRREQRWLPMLVAHGAIVCPLITLVWKLSIHTGTVAATALILAIVFGPPLLALEVFAALVAWARVELGVHTPGQVIGGGVIGAAVPAAVFLLLR